MAPSTTPATMPAAPPMAAATPCAIGAACWVMDWAVSMTFFAAALARAGAFLTAALVLRAVDFIALRAVDFIAAMPSFLPPPFDVVFFVDLADLAAVLVLFLPPRDAAAFFGPP